MGENEKSEKWLERELCRRVKELGGVALKYSSATRTGYPDRVCLLPEGVTVWVELKSKGKHPTALQSMRIADMRALGSAVHVVDSVEKLERAVGDMEKRIIRAMAQGGGGR